MHEYFCPGRCGFKKPHQGLPGVDTIVSETSYHFSTAAPLCLQVAHSWEGDKVHTEVSGLPGISRVTGISVARKNQPGTRDSRMGRGTGMRQRSIQDLEPGPQPPTKHRECQPPHQPPLASCFGGCAAGPSPAAFPLSLLQLDPLPSVYSLFRQFSLA